MSLVRKILILCYVLVAGVFNYAVIGIAFHVPEAGDPYIRHPEEVFYYALIALILFCVAVYSLWVKKRFWWLFAIGNFLAGIASISATLPGPAG